ncbi:hypothetical protein AMS68_004273 [Peltaster fructicola]|uniref:Mid2 domain-containing protein n=1 Tax=Peltaster fructicola TaxID=286661 RepID=A0A6H0XVP1_9PEZI|nr:hypothetical protein AMS68_004273 [Peltaster fructicola]
MTAVKAAQILSVPMAGVLCGMITCMSLVGIPAITMASAETASKQWKRVYDIGSTTMPPLVLGVAACFGFLAIQAERLPGLFPDMSLDPTAPRALYAMAAISMPAIVPYTIAIMKPTNDILMARANSSAKISAKDAELPSLLAKWARMNYVPTGCVSGNLIVGTTTGTCGSGSTCQSVFVYATNPTVGPIQTNVVCANTFHANTIFRTWLESATTTKTSTIYSLYPITAASQTSSAVPSTSSSSSGGGSGLSSSSVIAVAVVIPVVVLAIIATLLFFWWRRKSRTRNNPAVSGPAYDAVGDQRAYYAHNPDAVTGQTYEMGQENQPVELPNKNHPSNAAKVQEMYADNPNMGPHELTGSSPHGRR